MNLAELQHGFRSWLTESSEDAARALAGGAAPGLLVYQNNYRAQLIGCLETSYPQVRGWMGEDNFRRAAVAHINRHPPHAWTLDAYADQFGDTLRELHPRNPDLHELTWLELALNHSFIAGDAEPLAAAALATVNWDTARLRFIPSLLLTAATTNAADIWDAMQEGTDVPEGRMLAETGGLLVWRRGYVSRLLVVDALEYEALSHALANGSFSALCELLVQRLGPDHGVAKAGALLAGWISGGLLAAIDS